MNTLQSSQIIGSFRLGERSDIREFIIPNGYEIDQVYNQFSNLPEADRIAELWGWVCVNIDYPFTRRGAATDLHVMQCWEWDNYPLVGRIFRRTFSSEDYWQTPAETIAWGIGDCEDSSVLLCSLLRRFLPEDKVFVSLGFVGDYGHAWVECDGQYLETTLDYLPSNPPIITDEGGPRSQAKFNDKVCYGTLDSGPDARALPLIEKIWGVPTKRIRRLRNVTIQPRSTR